MAMNKNVTKFKRSLALALAVMMVLTFIPIQSSAIASGLAITNPGADPVTTLPTSLQNGQLWTDKSVTYQNNGQFQVTLKAMGQDYKVETPTQQDFLDVILVLDCSDSMDETLSFNTTTTKLASMKNAAAQAVNIILGVEGNRVSVVKFNNNAVQTVPFTTTSGTATAGINALQTTSTTGNASSTAYTNIQDGFRLAKAIINNRNDADKMANGQFRKPIVILMSDGSPTRYIANITSAAGNTGATAYPTTNDAVKWTVRQGMDTHLNTGKAAIDIYTIGFGVNDDPKAIGTLMPTATYTGQYNQNGSTSGNVQYYRDRNDSNTNWNNWQVSTSGFAGSYYKAPYSLGSVSSSGSWTSFTDNYYLPENIWSWTRGSAISGTSFSVGTGANEVQFQDYSSTATGTAYRNIVASSTFNYKYWSTGSSVVGADAEDLVDAFLHIANSLVGFKPMSYTIVNDTKVYTPVTITDVLGSDFELVGSLPAGVTQNGNTVTWSIPADQFTTMAYDSTTIDQSKVHSVSFTVKVKDSAVAGGPYYTNASAQGSFSVPEQNPYYTETGTVTQPLNNRGWLSLYAPQVDATVTITKEIIGPVNNTNRTFTFNLYYSPDGNPINNEPISITVNGEDSASEDLTFSIPSGLFNANGNLDLYAKEMETTADPFWNYDTAYHKITINRATPSGDFTFTNTYAPTGTLTVTKAWEQGAPETDDISFDLEYEVAPGQWGWIPGCILDESNNWTMTFRDLALNTKYRVVENPVPQDYDASYDKETIMFTGETLEASITITNDYNVPKGKITVNKVWEHGDNPVEDRPESVTFSVTGPDDVEYPNVTLSGDADDATWSNVFQTETFGTYTFTEVVPQDYKVDNNPKSQTVTISPVTEREASLTFTNTWEEPKGTMTVTKEWVGDEDDDSFRPKKITLKLIKGIGTLDSEEVDSVTLPENDGTPWSHTFTDLEFGTYGVEEEDVPDYDVDYLNGNSVTLNKYAPNGGIESRTGGITVTNTFENPTGEITVEKTWAEGDVNSSAVRPSEITVALMNGNVEVDSVTLPEDDDSPWVHTFTGLPLNGDTYTVAESAEGSDLVKLNNYDASIQYYVDGTTEEAITLTHSDRSGNANIINTYGKGTITVTKVWSNEDNNPSDERPRAATITLWKHVNQTITFPEVLDELGNILIPETTLSDTIITKAGIVTITRPETTAVFYDLEMGENISYYVTEESIPFYTTYYSTNEDGGVDLNSETPNGQITLTNVYDDPRGELTVNKIWDFGNDPDQDDLEGNGVQVTLYANGEEVKKATVYDSYTFVNLTLGAIYTVSETPIDNYDTDYSTDSETVVLADGMLTYTPVKGERAVATGEIDITNEYIPEVGDLEVNKLWKGKTGGPVTVTLERYYEVMGLDMAQSVADGTFTREAVLNSDNNWSCLFENLELYGPGGVTYYYKATESMDDQNLYIAENPNTPALNTEETATITITNNYNPDQGSLTIEKVWENANGDEISPPVDAIGVTLVVDGTPQGASIELNAANNWKTTISRLDVDKTYSVLETTYDEAFRATYSSESINFTAADLDETITVTNTRITDTPEITVTKSASDTTALLVSGAATFVYTVDIENTGNRTLRNLYILDEVTAETTGATITYSPEPDEFSGGEARFDLEGSLAPGDVRSFTYSITVDKAGDYTNLATVYGIYGDGQEISGSDLELVTVKDPGLTIIKSVIGPDSARGKSGTFTYELRVRNDAGFPLYGVEITDVMTPADLNAIIVYNVDGENSWSFNSETNTFIIGEFDPENGDIIISYSVSISGSYGQYSNEATVTGFYENDYGYGELTDSDDATVTLRKPSTRTDDPDDPIVVPDDPTPESPVVTTPEQIVIEDDIPAAPLPKTGGVAPYLIYGLGLLLAGGGLAARRKENKDK